jgi:hypothetical protein
MTHMSINELWLMGSIFAILVLMWIEVAFTRRLKDRVRKLERTLDDHGIYHP